MAGYDTCATQRRTVAQPASLQHPPCPANPKKGYFVKGHFVAEGSELDLELRAEQTGGEPAAPS
jgi:hypothetical protein